jgi:hypothetical protein
MGSHVLIHRLVLIGMIGHIDRVDIAIMFNGAMDKQRKIMQNRK